MTFDELDPRELADALDQVALRRLQARYGDIVTRRAWSELDSIILPDARIELDLRRSEPITLSGPTELAAMIDGAVARFEFFEVALLNAVVDVVDDGPRETRTATGRVYMWDLRQDRESGRWTNAFGLYRDHYVRHEGRWVIGSRRYSSLARTAELLFTARREAATGSFPPAAPADYASDPEATPWGPARRLKPPLHLSNCAMRWDRPAQKLGSASAHWENRVSGEPA